VYVNFLRVNSNTRRNRAIGHCWDGTYNRDGYIMRLAEFIMCRCLLENGTYVYLIQWADWRRKIPTWITRYELMQQLTDECIDLIYEFDVAISLVND